MPDSKKIDLILDRLESIQGNLSTMDNRLTNLETDISILKRDMKKVLKCVDHENADMELPPRAKPTPKPSEKAKIHASR